MKLTGWARDHARAVADRCAKRFRSRAEIERYLLAIGWDADSVDQMLGYIDKSTGGHA